MAQRIESLIPVEESKLLASSIQADQFPRIKAFFDGADFIVERTKNLMGNSKDLSLRVALFLFIIKDIIKWLW